MALPLPAAAACVVSAIALVPSVPAVPPLHLRIDALIAAAHPAPPAADAEFLRRVTLDLTGTIPTADEVRAFLADRDPAKRTKLIDRLLASPGYARRMADHFDVVFMERRGGNKVAQAAWQEFLRESFAANKPYDQLVREILSADGVDAKTRGPAKFYLDRDLAPDVVTRDIGRIFLGRDLQCAQCHDHPQIADYKQEQYYGVQAFLNRVFLYPKPDDANAVIAEKADGEVSFVNVFDRSQTKKGTPPRLPGLAPIEDPMLEAGKEYRVAPAKDVRPVPTYSRWARLAEAVTDRANPAFARTAVNRIWALLLGRGLIHPLDLDHSENPPSHPELLELLSDEFAARQFNVKWLVREIVQSQTYQRSSAVPPGFEPEEGRYDVALLKPLSAEQFAYAVLQATGFTDAERQAQGADASDASVQAKLAPHVSVFQRRFGGRGGEPEEFTATLDQALFLKHGATIRSLIAPRAGNTADRVLKQSDPAAAAEELFLSVLTRLPTDAERAEVAQILSESPDRRGIVCELIWALIASTEFRFNH
jgi:hypothetical protein